MAEAVVKLSELSRTVECVICQEQLHKPKSLPCHHTFCKECLDGLMKFKDDGSSTLKCPFNCAGVVTLNSNQTTNMLPNNFSLQDVLQLLNTSNSRNGSICEHEDCENHMSRICFVCNCKTCKVCWEKHQCGNKSFSAVAFDLKSNSLIPVCEQHDAYAKYVCFTCEKIFVCIYCVNRMHKSHEIKSLQKYASLTRKSVQLKIKAVNKLFSRSTSSYRSDLTKIDEFRSQLKKELKERTIYKLNQYLTQLKNEEEKLLNQFDDNVSKFKEDVETSGLLYDTHKTHLKSYIKQLASKQNLDILFEQNVILEILRPMSSLRCFNASLQENSEHNTLAQLTLSFCKMYSNSNKGELIQTKFSKVYENDTEIQVDVTALEDYFQDFAKGLAEELASKEMEELNQLPIHSMKRQRQLFKTNYFSLPEIINWMKYDQFESLNLLLECQPDIVHKSVTLFYIAAALGKHKALKLLLEVNSEYVNTYSDSGCTALIEAIHSNNHICVKLLLEHGAKVNTTYNGLTPLMYAIQLGDILSLKVLLDYHADVNIRNNKDYGCTALLMAVRNHQTSCVELLLKHHADVNVKDSFGMTPLMHTSSKGDVLLLEILLNYHADVNMIEKSLNYTALMWALQNEQTSCAELLLKHHADVNMVCDSKCFGLKNTALHDAVNDSPSRFGLVTSYVELLLDHGADVYIEDGSGKTALMLASEFGYTSYVDLLLKGHTTLDVARYNCKALWCALMNGNKDCVITLLKHNAALIFLFFCFSIFILYILGL